MDMQLQLRSTCYIAASVNDDWLDEIYFISLVGITACTQKSTQSAVAAAVVSLGSHMKPLMFQRYQVTALRLLFL